MTYVREKWQTPGYGRLAFLPFQSGFLLPFRFPSFYPGQPTLDHWGGNAVAARVPRSEAPVVDLHKTNNFHARRDVARLPTVPLGALVPLTAWQTSRQDRFAAGLCCAHSACTAAPFTPTQRWEDELVPCTVSACIVALPLGLCERAQHASSHCHHTAVRLWRGWAR